MEPEQEDTTGAGDPVREPVVSGDDLYDLGTDARTAYREGTAS